MPTDTPAAAPSQLAREIVLALHERYSDEAPSEAYLVEQAMIVQAKLAPVLATMEMILNRPSSPVFQERLRADIRSLSPQPPEAQR